MCQLAIKIKSSWEDGEEKGKLEVKKLIFFVALMMYYCNHIVSFLLTTQQLSSSARHTSCFEILSEQLPELSSYTCIFPAAPIFLTCNFLGGDDNKMIPKVYY